MSDATWCTWTARVGYYQHERQHKELAEITFKAPNLAAAESYARRHAEALFQSSWGPYYTVVGPMP